jgi:integrase
MLEMLLGSDGKRKLRLRHKTNSELFALYDSQLVLKHRSREALEEARRVLRHFQGHLGEYPPTPELAAAYLAQFKNHKPTTLYRYDSILKGFMAWYGEPLDTKIKVPETLPDYIEDSDVEKLKEAMRSKKTHKKVIDRNILLIDLATKTGLRRSEIADLRVSNINLAQRYLIVRMGKGMKDRIVDLTPSLTLSLETFIKGKKPEERVFGLQATTISGLIHWAAAKAEIDIHTHSLRHFFGERLVDTGTDMEIVRRLMGHSSLATTQRYIGRTDKQRRDAIDRMDKQGNKDHETDDAKRQALEMEKLEREVMRLRLDQAKL